jgi:hypothetical protein
MAKRVAIIVLFGLLVGSLSFNAIQMEEVAEAKRQSEFDSAYYPRLLALVYEREPE